MCVSLCIIELLGHYGFHWDAPIFHPEIQPWKYLVTAHVCLCVYIIRLKMLVSDIELLLWIFIKFRLREYVCVRVCVCALCVPCVC